MLAFCNEQLGKPAERRTGLFAWDTTDGNVILQTAEARDGFAVNLFLTARSVRESGAHSEQPAEEWADAKRSGAFAYRGPFFGRMPLTAVRFLV